jgi:hypothetical protein
MGKTSRILSQLKSYGKSLSRIYGQDENKIPKMADEV